MKKNHLILVGAAGLVLLSACDTAASRDAKRDAGLIKKAENAFKESALNPDAAQFRNMRVTIDTGEKDGLTRVVCGEVNAKNAYGAYTGFRDFYYVVNSSEITVPDGQTSLMCQVSIRRETE